MPDDRETHDITGLLNRWSLGDVEASNQLMELVYGDLHRIAAREMRREQPGHTLQTTAVLNEAYLRIFRGKPVDWKDRAHFYASAAQQLRRVLLDHARRAHSEKRGGHVVKLSLVEFDVGELGPDSLLLALNEALTKLEALDPRAAKVVELRFFGGLKIEEVADIMSLSLATVKRDWTIARA